VVYVDALYTCIDYLLPTYSVTYWKIAVKTMCEVDTSVGSCSGFLVQVYSASAPAFP